MRWNGLADRSLSHRLTQIYTDRIPRGKRRMQIRIKITIRIAITRQGASRAHRGIIAQGTEFKRVMAATILIT
jgi:hypothetical protein